jgi:hypothetical protein
MPSLFSIVNGDIRHLQTIQKLNTIITSTKFELRHLSYSSDPKIDDQKANRAYTQIQKI